MKPPKEEIKKLVSPILCKILKNERLRRILKRIREKTRINKGRN